MKVKNLHLYRFRGFEDLQISFPKDAQMLVFIGENGSGKSSLLEGMSMILSKAFSKYYNYVRVDWSNPDNVHSSHLKGNISIELQAPKKSYTFSNEILKESSMGTGRFNRSEEYKVALPPVILHYSVLKTTIETYKDAPPIAFNIPMTTDFEMILDWFIEQENDENRKRLRHDNNYRSGELQTIREVITKALTLLNGEKGNSFTDLQTETDETVKDGQVSSWLSITKNGLRLNVHQLSDGEKRIIILLIDITRRLITLAKLNKSTDYLNGAGIVLIDEIEQHLHPKWQRTFLPTLCKIFPNLQFVATTHSPQVLSYVPNGCAFSLENGKAYPQNTFGRNNEWILEAIMDDVSRPLEVQANLDAYFDLIREDKLTEAAILRKKLEEVIGADEPELLKADILIRRKQKSMAKNEAN